MYYNRHKQATYIRANLHIATKEDEYAREDDEASIMLGVILISDDDAAVVLQPCHGPLDLPAALIPAVLAMLVQHWVLGNTCWRYADRSLSKAAQTVRQYASWYLATAFDSTYAFVRAFATITLCLTYGCRLNKRQQQLIGRWLLLALELPLLA